MIVHDTFLVEKPCAILDVHTSIPILNMHCRITLFLLMITTFEHQCLRIRFCDLKNSFDAMN